MTDTMKKFDYAGNVAGKGAKKAPAPSKPGYDMGMGIGSIVEMIKTAEDMRSGPATQYPFMPQESGSSTGPKASQSNVPVMPDQMPPAVANAVGTIIQQKVKAETPDGLSIKYPFSRFLNQAEEIKRQKEEALQSPKGLMSELFGLAGLVAGAAGIANFSPALTMIGGTLSKESKAIRDDILEPYQIAEAEFYKQFGEEVEAGYKSTI